MGSAKSSVWENSVVIALRDFQWMTSQRAYGPDVYVPLAGTVEANGADNIMSIVKRLHILEVKGQVTNIKSEWLRRRRGINVPKPVHIKLMKLVRDVVDGTGDAYSQEHLRLSLQCHYFAYWAEKQKNDGPGIFDRLCMAPYIFATLQYMLRSNEIGTFINSGFDSKEHCANVFKKLSLSYQIETRAGVHTEEIQIKFAGTSAIQLKNMHGILPIGLDGVLFEKYLTFLCGGAEKARMHAVVLSPINGYFRYVRKFSDILALLPKPAPNPTPGPSNNRRRSARP